MARRSRAAIGLPVVYDLRAADVAAGGHGAPLVPVFHRALVRTLDRPHPIAVLNLGGVANITFIDGDADPIACDTGPANALIDDFMRARTGAPRDDDGNARGGGAGRSKRRSSDCSHIRSSHRHARNRSTAMISATGLPHTQGLNEKTIEDGAATLTMLTAASVARIVDVLPRVPQSWIVAGGGARNPTLDAHARREARPRAR